MANMKHVKELKKFAEKLGLEVEAKNRGGTHIGMTIKRQDGESTTLIVSSSPSDHRAMLNNHAFIKRFLRK
jgi:hypothetical protein